MALGLDGLHRKLLVLTHFKNGDYFDFIIHINDVQSFTVKKVYSYINAGQSKNGKPEKHLEEILLHIELYSQGHADIPFYNHINNRIDEIAGMENRAKKWETILNKLLTERFKKDTTPKPVLYNPSHHLKF